MNESAKDVAAADGASAGGLCGGAWWREVLAAMRSAPVVVLDVLGEYSLQVAPGEHEQVVEAILAVSSDPAFGKGVRPRGADWGEDSLGAR